MSEAALNRDPSKEFGENNYNNVKVKICPCCRQPMNKYNIAKQYFKE
jgi:hypothetical protein